MISKAKELALAKLGKGLGADEIVEIGDADGFKIYVTAGKAIDGSSQSSLHENPRDVFMLVLEGEVEFNFENGERATVKSGECFVLPKHLKHLCNFRRLTVTLEGVDEKEL
jgi:mannose-6-phosphate isomerase-like protein (cupin superfamily)